MGAFSKEFLGFVLVAFIPKHRVDLRCGYLILENADAFSSCDVQSRKFIQCPAGVAAGAKRRGGSPPAPRKASDPC